MESQHRRVVVESQRRVRKNVPTGPLVSRGDPALRAIESAVLDYWMGHGQAVLQLHTPSANAATLTQCPCCIRKAPLR